jgi:hypothetical protein
VIRRLRLDSTADLQEVKDSINVRYAQVCVEDRAKQNVATMTLTAGTDTYTLSASVERIEAMYVTPVGGTRQGPLELTSITDLIERKTGTTSSTDQGYGVTRYALLGIDEFVVWPTPQTADVVTIYYAGLPTALSADADTPVLHEPWCSKLLLHGPCADLAEAQRDWDAAQWHAALFEDWLKRYRTHLNRKRGVGGSTQQFRVVGAATYPPHDPSTDRSW